MSASIAQADHPIDLSADLRRLDNEQLRHRIEIAGLCQDVPDADDWFPAEPDPCDDEGKAAYAVKARRQCAGCEVTAECLLLALRTESARNVQAHGISGARSPWERNNLRRSLRRRDIVLQLPAAEAVAS